MARGRYSKRYKSVQIAKTWHPGPLRLGWVAVRRFRRGGAPLAAVGLGILIAVTLLCAVPLYTGLGSDAQIQSAVLQVPPADANIEVRASAADSKAATGESTLGQITGAEPPLLQHVAPTTTSYLEGPLTAPGTVNGTPYLQIAPALQNSYLQLLAYNSTDVNPHIHLLAGTLPSDAAPHGIPEVLVTEQMGLHVGDLVSVFINNSTLTMRVSGIWFPKDPNESYWNGRTFLVTQSGRDNPPPPPSVYSLLTTPAAYYSVFGAMSPSPAMFVHVVYFTEADRLNAGNMAAVSHAIQAFRVELSGLLGQVQVGFGGPVSGLTFTTRLNLIISTVTQQFTLSDLPLYIVIVQVVGLALLFVAAMGSLLVESQTGELAVLKSRGASDAQTLGALVANGLLPAIVALVAGPFLAAGLALLLIRLGIPHTEALVARDAQAGFLTRAALTRAALFSALAGVLMGLLALAVPAWQSARLDVLTFRREQARPTVVPLWRRYYLDLALAAFCAVGYLELSEFGGLDVRTLLSQSGAGNPTLVLLLAPALLLLAGGLALLRLVPWLLGLGFRWASRARGAIGLLAFAQLTRGAVRFSRLTLLLTLAVAMGIFALTFQASLDHNATDRALYQTGGDVRVQIRNIALNTAVGTQDVQTIPSLPGVTAATSIMRTSAETPANEGNREVPIAGIDPATFASAVHWRSDFADQPLSSLLSQMRRHVAGATAGQKDTPIWALISPKLAAAFSLQVGQEFPLVGVAGDDPKAYFVVGGVINNFPTFFDSDVGYLIADGADLASASANITIFNPAVSMPGEYWLRVSGSSAAAAARARDLADPNLYVDSVITRQDLEARFKSDPVAAGMTALLLAGAVLVACLAVLGGLVQAASMARQRTLQFAILRTLGTSKRELTNMFLLEQLVMYVLGLVGGLLLGLALSIATLPYLEFGSLLTDTAPPGIPPYVLVVNVGGVLLFFGALAIAFMLGLLWQRQVAVRVVLDNALRLGED